MSISTCIVAIARDEEAFLDEWLIYHREILKFTRFIIYDDGPRQSLERFLLPHAEYVTVIPWYERHRSLNGRNRQTKAYVDSLLRMRSGTDWVLYLDIDEFLVLPENADIAQFLQRFVMASAVSFNWRIFGNCGFFENPAGLVTASLIRRRAKPYRLHKTISRPEAIKEIRSSHSCELKEGAIWMDTNGFIFQDRLYEGIDSIAWINHYRCRSFFNWMQRVHRGDVVSDGLATAGQTTFWNGSEKQLHLQMSNSINQMKRFATEVACFDNELVDRSMLKFSPEIGHHMERIISDRFSNYYRLNTLSSFEF